ncbi:MAG: tetratricopeptide repeat protein, partial [Pontibacterium sp.]
LLSDLINEQPAQHIVDIAQMMRGFSEHWAGNSESAVKRFEPLMESTTEGLDKPAMAEVIKIAKGDYTDAIARLQAQLERQPKEPRPLLELAGIFERQGKTAKAIAVFEQYLAKAPDDHASRRRLAHIYFSQSQHNTGLIHLERYAFAVFTPESLTELAQNFFWVGDKAVAARVLRQRDHSFANTDHLWRFDANKTSSLAGTQAPLKASNNTEAQVLKQAQAKFNNDEFKAAAALLDQHLKTHPHDMYAHRLYAFTLSRLARFTEAASEFYVVSRSHLVSDDIFFHYGYNLARSGNYLAAKKVLRRLERHLVEALGEPSPNASDSLEKGIPAHLSDFISQWKAHWEARNFADYSRHYSEKIRTDQRWQAHKQTSFSRNSAIAVRVSDLHLLSKSQQGTAHHYRVRFTQDYTATTMKDRGEKTLSLLCAQNQPCLITQESWRPIKANVSQDAERVRLKISLLKQTRDELAKLDVQAKQPTQLDKVVNGMVFSQGVERFPKPEYEVLSVDPVSKMKGLNSPDASKVGWLARDLEIPYEDYGSQALVEDKQHVSLSTQHVSDSSSMGYRTLGVSANLLHKSGIMNVSADRYRFSHDDCAPQTGHRADANWTQAGYTVGTRVDSLNRKTLLSPYAGLTTQDDDRSQTWRAGVDTLFFDKLSCDTHRHQQRRVSIAYEHYAPVSIPFMADLWPKTHSVGAEPTSTPFTLWFGLQAGAIDDGNKEAIGQFDLSRALFSGDKVSTSLGLSGWYMFNSRPTDAYYSPKHYDSQTIRVDSEYLLTNNFRFKADARTGYSFDAQRVLYGAGLSAHYQAGFGASAELACRRNNTGGTGKTSAHFSTSQCSLIAGYAW